MRRTRAEPPEYLDSDDRERLNDVRRSIWVGGFKAGLAGLAAGAAFALVARRSTSALLRRFDGRHAVVAVLAPGAFGAYAGALWAGRARLDDIGGLGSTFEKGSIADRAQTDAILQRALGPGPPDRRRS